MAFAEFGLETWTATNWIGVGLWVVAVLVLARLGWRFARPHDDGSLEPRRDISAKEDRE